jgi:hypothetical protein
MPQMLDRLQRFAKTSLLGERLHLLVAEVEEIFKMRARPATHLWMGSAFGAALIVAAVELAVHGGGERGTGAALAATARLSFLLFWAAYAGGALTALFGATFQPLKQRAREFGLAFAAAHLAHLGLVGWLCWIGAAPPLGTFIFFGVAVIFTYLLALLSIGNLQKALGARWWWLLRTVGMNYIAYAFFVDFMNNPLHGGIKQVVKYLPFAILAIVGPSLRLAAWTLRMRNRWL